MNEIIRKPKLLKDYVAPDYLIGRLHATDGSRSLRRSVYRAAGGSNFLTYAEWLRMNPDKRAVYIAGAFDALITFAMSDEQRAVNAHYNNCIANSKMTVAQLAENVRQFAKGKPNLQDYVETPLINYLYQFCGAPPQRN